MKKRNEIKKPVLSRHLFWDTDMEKLDFDRFADFTIIRVLERGSENEIQEIIRYYGKVKIINAATHAITLLPRAVLISKKIFHLTDDIFQCLKPSQRARNYSWS